MRHLTPNYASHASLLRIIRSHGKRVLCIRSVPMQYNSAAEVCSLNLIDPADPRNEGIGGDHLVGTSNGVQLRRITYTDPRDGTHYTYLTNEMTLPPHQLVIIYKCRWDIEK